MARAFDAAEAAFGTVTILVNNAGVAHAGRAVDLPEAEWRRVLDTNLDAVFFWAQEAARRMQAADKGGVDRQHRLGARPRRRQGGGRLCHRQGRRHPADQGAGAGTGLQGHPRQRHRAGLVRHRAQPRLSHQPAGRGDDQRHSRRPLRPGRRSRRCRCCCSPPMPAPISPAPPSWSTAGRWWRCEDRSPWISPSRPNSTTSACARAPSLPSTCCRSRPIRRITTTHENIRLDVLAPLQAEGQGRRAVGAAGAEGVRRHGAARRRLGGDV